MTSKAGDIINIALRLEDATGAGLTYADATAFLAAGWAITWYQAHIVAASQPSYALYPRPDGALGEYLLEFTRPSGNWVACVTVPSSFPTYAASPDRVSDDTPAADTDSIFSLLSNSQGSLISVDRVASFDWGMIEADSFSKTMQVPALALADFGYADLSDVGGVAWRVSADARKATNPSSAADFSFFASISDKVNRKITLQLAANTAGAVVDFTDLSAKSQAFEYDAQLIGPALTPYSVIGVNTGAKTFTIAGDHRFWFGSGLPITVTGTNAGTYTTAAPAVLTSGNTVVTVLETIPSATVDGTIRGAVLVTGVEGVLTVSRQETKP